MDTVYQTVTPQQPSETSNIQRGVLIVPCEEVIAFEQNQRDEVRITPVAGAVKAQPGMKNQTYVVRTAQTGANGIGVQEGMAHAIDAAGPEAVLTSSTEDSPVRTSAWPASGAALKATALDFGLSLNESCPNCGHDGRLLRMSRDFYPQTAETISASSSTAFANSGIASAGRYWTRKTSESRSAADACSLSQVLESKVSERYYLSAKAAAGILRRAARRGKKLPARLEVALKAVSEGIETTSTEAEPS
jgi:hypothetical protein